MGLSDVARVHLLPHKPRRIGRGFLSPLLKRSGRGYNVPLPSPPADEATAHQDQAGKALTSDGAGDRECGGIRRESEIRKLIRDAFDEWYHTRAGCSVWISACSPIHSKCCGTLNERDEVEGECSHASDQ